MPRPEVLCPECADKQGCASGQEDSVSAAIEGGHDLGIDSQQDQLFINSMIKRLPKYQQGDLGRLCKTHSERCRLYGARGHVSAVAGREVAPGLVRLSRWGRRLGGRD